MSPDGPRSPAQAAERPAAAILDLLATAGQLPERTLLVETPYPVPACRRALADLASRGTVVRRDTGAETVVCLVDGRPATSRPEGESTPRANDEHDT